MTHGAPRLLIIGAGGFLGGYLTSLGSARFECVPAGRSGCGVRLDITDAAGVRNVFGQTRPDAVVLAAGLSDIDDCERKPDVARETNVAGAWNVAHECARSGARLVFTSSGAVFDGEAREYGEDSVPNPVSVYGRTKTEAERMVSAELPGAVIVRLSLVLGKGLARGTNSFLDKVGEKLDAAQPVIAAQDEYRNAIDVATAARWILDLAATPPARGVFHLGSGDAMSRLEIVRRLALALGYPAELVVPQSGADPNRAPRGRRHMLVPGRIGEVSGIPVPTCLQSVERCVHAAA
jgi:dTDP-4-dehydrorhamnose reductase